MAKLRKRRRRYARRPHILVVDDDPVFRAVMKNIGRRREIPVTVCGSLREMAALATPRVFDVAIIDYYLDDLEENLRGTRIAALMGDTPVILVSAGDRCVEDYVEWPDTVRKFVAKEAGSAAIFDTALGACHEEAL